MLQVKRAGHSTLTTPDIGRMVDYFTRIVGLSLVARDKDRAILTSALGHEVAVFKRGSAARCTNLSFQVSPKLDLSEVGAALSKLGVYTQNDVQRLAARVDELAEAVNKLIASTPGETARPVGAAKAARPARARKAAAKPAAKKRAARKRAAKATPSPTAE